MAEKNAQWGALWLSKGKGHPRRAHEGLKAEWRYSCILFLTLALDGWVVNATPRLLYPRGRDTIHIVQEAGWAPGQVWMGAEILSPLEFDPRTVQIVPSRYSDYAMPPHFCTSPNTIRMCKWHRMGLVGDAAWMGETRDGYRSFVIELDRKRIPGHILVDEKTILKWIWRKRWKCVD